MNTDINNLHDEIIRLCNEILAAHGIPKEEAMAHRGIFKTSNIGYMEALYGVDENELLEADENELMNNLVQNLKKMQKALV